MSERSITRQEEKQWYTILAPERFDRAEIGETMASEPEAVLDRTVETTLGDLTGDASATNAKLTFRIDDVGSNAAYTAFERYELTRDYRRSLVRRGASKVEDTLRVLTTDDYRVKIQPVAYTTRRADDSQKFAVRKVLTETVEDAADERAFEEFTDSVIEERLSSAIYAKAKEIYPIRRVEIAKLVLEATPEEVAEEEETAADVDAETIEV
jgi:small subunit ribosomal protein S3Ae